MAKSIISLVLPYITEVPWSFLLRSTGLFPFEMHSLKCKGLELTKVELLKGSLWILFSKQRKHLEDCPWKSMWECEMERLRWVKGREFIDISIIQPAQHNLPRAHILYLKMPRKKNSIDTLLDSHNCETETKFCVTSRTRKTFNNFRGLRLVGIMIHLKWDIWSLLLLATCNWLEQVLSFLMKRLFKPFVIWWDASESKSHSEGGVLIWTTFAVDCGDLHRFLLSL